MLELQMILDAWTVEGSHPSSHRKARIKLRKEWPALAQALDNAALQNNIAIALSEAIDDLPQMRKVADVHECSCRQK